MVPIQFGWETSDGWAALVHLRARSFLKFKFLFFRARLALIHILLFKPKLLLFFLLTFDRPRLFLAGS